MLCGRYGLWLIWFVADMVMLCGQYGLWPMWLNPFIIPLPGGLAAWLSDVLVSINKATVHQA